MIRALLIAVVCAAVAGLVTAVTVERVTRQSRIGSVSWPTTNSTKAKVVW